MGSFQKITSNHGFNCDHTDTYNAPAAKLALERTLAFFTTNLIAK
jgi:carboxymethylenebutenolidase